MGKTALMNGQITDEQRPKMRLAWGLPDWVSQRLYPPEWRLRTAISCQLAILLA